MKTFSLLLLFGVITVMASGCGTVMSRGGENFFGAYPYQSTAADVGMCGSTETIGAGLPSFPFDLILDTVFLPLDLGFWVAGQHKDGILSTPW
jgi:uncharacterized protein YceK